MDSTNWYIIDPQPTMNSGFENEEWDDWVKDSFDEVLTETKLGQDVVLCNGLYDKETGEFETEFETEAVIQNVTPDAYTQGWKRQILTRISDNLADYKYIKVKDTKDNWQIYLIMTMPDSNHMYTKAVIHECNYTLRWQEKTTGTIFDYPCFVEDASQYNTGRNNVNSVMWTPYNQLMAWMPFDDNTIDLHRDIRMFIDYTSNIQPAVYTITSTSKVPYSYNENRIVRITFTESEYNPDTDRIDLMICDYFNPEDIPQPIGTVEIIYTGEPQIKIGGRKTFRVESEYEATFSLVMIDMLINKVTLEQGNNQCIVKCVNDEDIIGSHFKLIAAAHGRESELLITIKGVM